PQVELSVYELTTENCLKALDFEEIDLAILATSESKSKYFQKHVYNETMDLFIHPQHPLAKKKFIHIDDLKAEQMWLLEEGHCLREEIIKICHLRKNLQQKPQGLNLKVGSLESLRYLVQENFGYTLLPKLSTLRIPKSEKKLLRKIVGSQPQRSIFFTMRRKHLREGLISVLEKIIVESVKNRLA
ncbi:MAG: hypothetical protein KDD40_01330, partial [Bdellovibrionales bacterium]|nr:hypothetical protein [Bdellovibrionales bacterium]